jgi:dipeptidyl aminopeptidase/acylaminoacyl peptidase
MASMYNAPSFVAAIYPVVTMRKPYVHKRSRRGLLGEYLKLNRKMQDSLSLELHADRVECPVFLSNCKDDNVVDYHNSVLMDSALTAARKPHSYLQYATGGHGYGIKNSNWLEEFLNWINNGK